MKKYKIKYTFNCTGVTEIEAIDEKDARDIFADKEFETSQENVTELNIEAIKEV